MAVTVGQAGNSELAAQVDHSRRRRDVGFDVGVRPDCDDAVTDDGGGLRLRTRRIHRHDMAVGEHEGGGARLSVRDMEGAQDSGERERGRDYGL